MDILKVLIGAKEHYENRPCPTGMCWNIYEALLDIELSKREMRLFEIMVYEAIPILIPEFNREFCNATNSCIKSYWWDISDRDSRIKAFDKLIKHYTNE